MRMSQASIVKKVDIYISPGLRIHLIQLFLKTGWSSIDIETLCSSLPEDPKLWHETCFTLRETYGSNLRFNREDYNVLHQDTG